MIKNYLCSTHKSLILSFVLALFSLTAYPQEIPTEPASISAGEQLFNTNCKTCHRVKQKLIGPALAGVQDRVPSIDWIKSFVKNSSAVIASGDAYAVKIFNENNKLMMTSFPLKDADIMNILGYVKAEAEKPDTPIPAPGVPVPAGNAAGAPQYLNLILIGMLIILILLVVILIFLLSAIKRFLDQRPLTDEEREVVHSPISLVLLFSCPNKV